MSWKGTGRSGYGDQAILGDYDDWDGLSMNGRQWKSRETKETRDLSGADLWHQRKALEPKMLEDIPTYVNGRPNIQAFAEPVSKPKAPAKKTSAFSQIMLADKNYTRLCSLSEQLDQELDAGHIPDFESYCAARKNIDKRLAAAWLRVCKERNWTPEGESLDSSLDSGLSFSLEDAQEARDTGEKQRVKRELTGWSTIDSLSEENCFRGLFCKVKKIMMFLQKIKQQL